MKLENQYNDNLELFFKQHLENHSPELSSDFWEEMEALIPAKPPFWLLWTGAAKQFLFPIILLLSLLIVSLFYGETIQEKENLSVLLLDQQMKIEEIEQQNEVLRKWARANATGSVADILSSKRKASPSERRESRNATSSATSSATSTLNDKKEFNPIVIHKQNKPKKVSKSHRVSSFTNTTSIKNSDIIPFLTPNKTRLTTRANPKNTLSQIAQIKGDFLLKNRLSFEGGTLFFVQNLKTETATPNGTSFGASLLINFELSPRWLLQSGFQIKNISSTTVTRSYSSFPLGLKRKILLNRCFLEPRLGFAFNFLSNSKTPERFRSSNAKAAYIDVSSSLALAISFNQNLHFIVEPNIAYSITSIVDNEKAFSYGLQLGIRYEN